MYNIDFIYNLNEDIDVEYIISVNNVESLSKDQFIKEVLKCISDNNHKVSDIHTFNVYVVSMYDYIVKNGDSEDRLHIFTINNDIHKKLTFVKYIDKYHNSIMQEFRYQKQICTNMIRDGLIVVSKEDIC